MKIKLSKMAICKSVLTFIIGYGVLLAVLCSEIAINNIGSGYSFVQYISENIRGCITVSISVAIVISVLYIYFFFENRTVLARCSKIIELFLLLYISLFLCNIIGKFVDPTARSLLFFSLMAAIFFRRRDAIFVNFAFVLVLFIFNRLLKSSDMSLGTVEYIQSYASLLTIFCGGTIGIYVMKNIKTRMGTVMVAVILLFPVVLINIVMQLTVMENFTVQNFFEEFFSVFLYGALDCVFSVLLFMFFMPVFEALFSELTPFRLRELTSDNARLMKMLKENAPGTFNHSIVVAQLAEACASAIGEDADLARACAYYHDVGKLKNPEMFAENQSGYDMHKELTPELSADIIRSHARDGEKLIKKNHLPEIFADVAVQHHGTLPIKYFYAKALKMSDGELNAENYSYAGPTPKNKIAAIIMIADASEAAARSLKDRSPEKVEALVNNLVEERMNMDQFVDCNITMRELTVIARTVVNSLTGVYHSRVAYPKLVLSKKN